MIEPQHVVISGEASFVQDARHCARKLGAVAQACRGPRGRRQLLRADKSEGSGAVLITTVSARLFAPLTSRPSRPSIQLLVDAVTRHHAIHGDAGLLIMQLATKYCSLSTFVCPCRPTCLLMIWGVHCVCSLVDRCLELGIGRQIAAMANTLAQSHICAVLTDNQCPCKARMEWSSMEGVLALARGVLLSKPLALPALPDAAAEYLCIIVAQVSLPFATGAFESATSV